MNDQTMKRASLADIKRMRERGELFHDSNAPSGGENLGPEFWAKAQIKERAAPHSVHLKLDPDVFAFFHAQGKGHLTRMQNVLRAYVEAHRTE